MALVSRAATDELIKYHVLDVQKTALKYMQFPQFNMQWYHHFLAPKLWVSDILHSSFQGRIMSRLRVFRFWGNQVENHINDKTSIYQYTEMKTDRGRQTERQREIKRYRWRLVQQQQLCRHLHPPAWSSWSEPTDTISTSRKPTTAYSHQLNIM